MNKTAIRNLCSLTLAPMLAAAPQWVHAQSTFNPTPSNCLDPVDGALRLTLTPTERDLCIAAGYGGSAPPPPAPPPPAGPGLTSSALAPLGTPLLSASAQSGRDRLNEAQTRLRAANSGQRQRALGFYTTGFSDLFGRDSDFRVRSESLSAGADKRLNENWVLGSSVAMLRSRTRFSENQSQQRSTGGSAAVYSSWSPSAASYLSTTLINEGRSFDLTRDSGTGLVSTAHTRGRTLGLSLAGGHDFARGAWSASPFARWDTLTTRIAAFDESGSSDAVSVDAQRACSRTLNLGTNIQYSIPQSWGLLLPYARVELTRRTDKNLQTGTVRLLSDGSPLLIPTSTTLSQDYGTLGLGLTAITPYGFRAFIDYQSGFKLNGYRMQSVAVGIRHEL